MGNEVTKYPVKKILLKTKGVSTLAGRKIWFDDILKRLNADSRGRYLGEFDGEDKILTVLSNGTYELTSFDLNNHFDDKMQLIEKYDAEKVFAVVHYDGKSKNYLVKRFVFENTPVGRQSSFISEEPGSKLVLLSSAAQPIVKVEQLKGKTQVQELVELNLTDLIDVKGMKAMGNRLSAHPVQTVQLIAEHDDAEDVPDPAPDSVADTQVIVDVSEEKEIPDVSPEKAAKIIEMEITNPQDVDLTKPLKKNDDDEDDIDLSKGQLGLF